MTLRKMAKTVTVGTSPVALNVEVEFGGRLQCEMVIVTNLSVNELGVDVTGGTAALDGDDVLHVLAGRSVAVPYPAGGTLSVIASAPSSKVEFASDRRTPALRPALH